MSRKKILGDRYAVGDAIGSGAFSTVYTCDNIETKERFAVKVISKSALAENGMEEAFERECKCLRRLAYSPHVANFVEVLQSTRNYYLITDLAKNGTLLNMIVKTCGPQGLPNHSVRKYFTQLLQGLRDIHACEVVHRDIKPDNLLLDEWYDLRISDFGFAAIADDHRILTRQCGTPQYVAPEVLKNEGYVGTKADVWSAGVTLYVMLCKRLPFSANDTKRLYELIAAGKYAIPQRDPSLLHLLQCCLTVDATQRWSVAELLRHPFLSGRNLHGGRPLLPLSASHPSHGELYTVTGEPMPDDDVDGLRETRRRPRALAQQYCQSTLAVSATISTVAPPDCPEVTATCSLPELRTLLRDQLGGRYDPLGDSLAQTARKFLPINRPGATLPKAADGSALTLPPGVPAGSSLDASISTSPSATPSHRRHTPERASSTPASRGASTSPQDAPTTSQLQPERFTNRLHQRLGWVHIKIIVHFLTVCVVLATVTLLRLLFGTNKWPLPRAVTNLFERLLGDKLHATAAPRVSSPGKTTSSHDVFPSSKLKAL